MPQENSPARFGRSTVRGAWIVVAASVVLLVVASWFPFRLASPFSHRSLPEWSVGASGTTVAFDGTALLYSDGEPGWMAEARERGQLSVVVEARTDVPEQYGPARVIRFGEDISEADLMIGHHDDDLHVRVRRAGSKPTGEPAYVLDGFFAGGTARSAELQIDGERVTILLDGAVVVDERLDEPVLDGWDDDHSIAVGDEPDGERGWVGELSRLEVRTGPSTVDLLAPGTLAVAPERDLHPRIREDAGLALDGHPALAVARLLALVPFGVAIHLTSARASNPTRRWLLRSALLLPLLLMAGKFVIEGRHPSPVNTALEVLGALLGYALAGWWWSRRRPAVVSSTTS